MNMEIIGKHEDVLNFVWGQEQKISKADINRELRAELDTYRKKYKNCRSDIKEWEKLVGKSIKSKLSNELLNDCINFVINKQLCRENNV